MVAATGMTLPESPRRLLQGSDVVLRYAMVLLMGVIATKNNKSVNVHYETLVSSRWYIENGVVAASAAPPPSNLMLKLNIEYASSQR